MNFEWVIIGGGIHGVHIAARLIGEVGVRAEQLRILDPNTQLLQRWQSCTTTTGMSFLRSPVVHHLDLDPWALQRFAGKRTRRTRKKGLFAPPYDRPALSLFNKHCNHVIENYGLDALHIQDRAISCSLQHDGVTIQTGEGLSLKAHNVVLAIGASDQPNWPSWAPRDSERVAHIFTPEFKNWPSAIETVAVVGGGISAAQVALRLVDAGHKVHLISRHALREHQFDSDPGWLGPKNMGGFTQERNRDERRKLINKARHKGSVPPDVRRATKHAIQTGLIDWHECNVVALDENDEGFELHLSDDTTVQAERVLLATGFTAKRPGGKMIDALIESASLPCAQCGYPIVDASLRWHPRIYVTGPLAELELGPVARNIAGAQRAGGRLVEAVKSASQHMSDAP